MIYFCGKAVASCSGVYECSACNWNIPYNGKFLEDKIFGNSLFKDASEINFKRSILI